MELIWALLEIFKLEFEEGGFIDEEGKFEFKLLKLEDESLELFWKVFKLSELPLRSLTHSVSLKGIGK